MGKRITLGISLALIMSGFAKADTISFTLTNPTHGTSTNDFNYNVTSGLSIGSGLNGSVTSDKQLTTGPLNSLIYTDIYMVLIPTSIAPQGAATATNVGGGLTEISQQLHVTSTFEILTGLKGKVFDNNLNFLRNDAGSLLLSGTISGLIVDVTGVIGASSGTTGAIKANDVTYTGGEIYADFPQSGLTNPGTFTFNLTGINFSSGFGVNGSNQLKSFAANGGGEFDATVVSVPLPLAAWSGMGLMGMMAGATLLRRKNSDALPI